MPTSTTDDDITILHDALREEFMQHRCWRSSLVDEFDYDDITKANCYVCSWAFVVERRSIQLESRPYEPNTVHTNIPIDH